MSAVANPHLWTRRALSTLLLGVLPLGARGETGKVAVHIDNFAFSPAELKIQKGTEVTWTNNDDIPHTVLFIKTGVRSKTMDTDASFSYKFDKIGTFDYICGLHPHMKGKAIVTE